MGGGSGRWKCSASCHGNGRGSGWRRGPPCRVVRCVVVCRSFLARAESSRLGGCELSTGGGMGKVAGGSHGRVRRVSEEQPAAAGLSWVVTRESRVGWLLGLSADGGKCCV